MKVKFSGVGITEARGASGTSTISRNHYGNYKKVNSPVTDPNTSYQQLVRNAYALVSSLWSLLDDKGRTDWQTFANEFNLMNNVGNSYTYTGQIMFIKCNINLLIADGTLIPDPPPIIRPLGYISFFVVQMDATQITLGGLFPNGSSIVPADTTTIIYATPQFNPGRMIQRNLYKGMEQGAPGSDWNVPGNWTNYLNYYPLPTVGNKVFFKVRTISTISGLSSVPMFCSGIMQ